jgi:hypothetical protein
LVIVAARKPALFRYAMSRSPTHRAIVRHRSSSLTGPQTFRDVRSEKVLPTCTFICVTRDFFARSKAPFPTTGLYRFGFTRTTQPSAGCPGRQRGADSVASCKDAAIALASCKDNEGIHAKANRYQQNRRAGGESPNRPFKNQTSLVQAFSRDRSAAPRAPTT